MIRAIFLLLLLAAFMLGAAWFADRPGQVAIEWEGWRLSTSVPVLLAAIAISAAIMALLYRCWSALVGAPRAFGRWRRERRRRQGYVALTQGMVAVAAGDPDEARRQARRADVLLSEPPLTMLLSAQAAQLNGDENAAGRYFTQMLERRETEFLGLRGLLIQAMRKGDHERAIALARRSMGAIASASSSMGTRDPGTAPRIRRASAAGSSLMLLLRAAATERLASANTSSRSNRCDLPMFNSHVHTIGVSAGRSLSRRCPQCFAFSTMFST